MKNKKTQMKAEEMHEIYEQFGRKYAEMSKKYDPEALLKGGLFASLEGLIECAPCKKVALDSIFAMIEVIMNKDAKSDKEKVFSVTREKIHELSKEVH
jgi:hypothetical protein